MVDTLHKPGSRQFYVELLWFVGAISTVIYIALSMLSYRFAQDVPAVERPTWTMLALFALAFICYWVAMALVLRVSDTRRLATGIFLSACLFRLAMLPSVPMHEIDIYRYIWDGAVFAEGVSPYKYPPQQLLEAAIAEDAHDHGKDLNRLLELRENSSSLAEVLGRIHYGEFPSPYPIVSQFFFACVAKFTSANASTWERLIGMKAMLVLFDLATLYVVMRLVRLSGMHIGWSVTYAWCPLLMKELANGGHLDSIAVFFTTLAVWFLCVTLTQNSQNKLLGVVVTGVLLALAIGAKLYPILLLPMFGLLWLRRLGIVPAIVGFLSTTIISIVLLYPLLRPGRSWPESNEAAKGGGITTTEDGMVDFPTPTRVSEPSAGIKAFFKQWEMNDLLFMFVLENLRSYEDQKPNRRPWFVILPAEWSKALVENWTRWSERSLGFFSSEESGNSLEFSSKGTLRKSSFQLCRCIVFGVYALALVYLHWVLLWKNSPQKWCRTGMLVLAWFWFTCPTQNPWYWCWILPFLPFARFRTWHVVGAMTMLYYLRFWLIAHFPDSPALGTAYDGEYFFYFVIPWIEFLPCLVALSAEYGYARLTRGEECGTSY